MRRFGTVDTFIEQGDGEPKLGRLVANGAFLRALLRYGTFDEFEVFCPSQHHIGVLSRYLERTLGDAALLSRITLSHALCLTDQLRRHTYEVFHVGGWYHYLPALAELRSRLELTSRISLSGMIHSLNPPLVGLHARNVVEAELDASDAIVCSSSHGRDALAQLLQQAADEIHARYGRRVAPGVRLVTIPLGVEEPVAPAVDRAAARRRLELGDDSVVLLYFGRISASQKADLTPLLFAFRRLLERVDGDLRLVIAGGAERPSLEHFESVTRALQIGAQVRFAPDVDGESKAALLAAADVFVSPVDNVQETFGITLLEAMSAGLPVVASDFSGYRELVEDGKTGFLVPTLQTTPAACIGQIWELLEPPLASLFGAQSLAVDVDALCRALEALIRNAELRRAFGARGRARVLTHYTWRQIIPRYEALWSELARTRSMRSATADPAAACGTGTSLGVPVAAPVGEPGEVARAASERDPLAAFRGYATRTLGPSDTFVLSELGRECLEGTAPWPLPFTDLLCVRDDASRKWLLERLHPGPTRWADLVLGLQESSVDLELVRTQLLWLAKHGIVRSVEPATTAPGNTRASATRPA